MPLQYIEHYLVQTADFEESIRWYNEVLGLTAGPTPSFGFPVQWMYIGDKDVLHITHGGKKITENRKAYLGQQSEEIHGSGVIDHIGFRCSGLREMIKAFQKKGIDFMQRQVNDQGLYQLFIFDPNGVKVELNFPVAEASGMVPEVRASSLTYQNV